jgi:hypothetical protein
MYSHLPLALVLLLIVHITPSDATLFPRTSRAIGRAADRVHRAALKRSVGLASDLHVALKGVLVTQPDGEVVTPSRVYCITKPGGGGATPPGGHSNGTSTSRPTSTSSASSAGSTVPPSPWKLVEAHVSLLDPTFFAWVH